jgi:predicted TIM-barrel fold metal-dependent hydrolase
METRSALAAPERVAGIPIIDTHQHLWDVQRIKPPWLDGAPEILRRSYVMSDYLAATEGLNVVKAIYMEIDADPRQHRAEAEYLLEICQSGQHPTVATVISGRPDSASFRDHILRYRGNRFIKGVRQVLHGGATPPGYCLQPQFVASMRLLGEIGMRYDLCLRPGELADGIRLVDQCPETRFILDHCGNADVNAFLPASSRGAEKPSHDPEQWRRDIREFAHREHVICKISGIIARVPEGKSSAEILAPVVNHCLDAFGPDRVVFGGDWPVCLRGASYRRWVELLREIISQRSEEQQRKLLYQNAAKFYELET